MKSSKIWLLLVDHKFQALGECFQVETSNDDVVGDLKDKVKEEKPEIFSLCLIDPDSLTVWQTVDDLVIDRSTAKDLKEILEKIDVNDEGSIRMLGESEKVAELPSLLPDGQVLLVQLPGMSRISTTAPVSYCVI